MNIKKNNSLDINLTGSYFVVPPQDLDCYLSQTILNKNIAIKGRDQTIWYIEKSDNGYIFGKALILINLENGDLISSINNITGSIGDNNKVDFTFESEVFKPSNIMIAIGDFFYNNDLPQFYMQITTPFSYKWDDGFYSNTSFLHKSNMIKVDPDYIVNINGEHKKVSDIFN